jgi:BlaI family transcriptional regulator, penicillinase repressor
MSGLPSVGELEILRVLWNRGPCTVREVHDALGEERAVTYNTIGKLLQIMEGKRLVTCDSSQRANVYEARVDEESTQTSLVRDLADRAFGGSAADLVLRAVGRGRLSERDREEMRRILEALEEP